MADDLSNAALLRWELGASRAQALRGWPSSCGYGYLRISLQADKEPANDGKHRKLPADEEFKAYFERLNSSIQRHRDLTLVVMSRSLDTE